MIDASLGCGRNSKYNLGAELPTFHPREESHMAVQLRRGIVSCFALASLLALALPVLAQESKDPRKLNVLFIVSDDLNCALGCYGNKVVKTPHLDRLAGRGVRFDRAYANYPVCNPSRTSFLSSRYPEITKVLNNATDPRVSLGKDFVFLPEHFRAHGYFAGAAGKIAHFPDALKWDIFSDPAHEPQAKAAKKKDGAPSTDTVDGRIPFAWKASNLKDADEPDGQVALRVVKMLEQNKDKPFFIAAGFHRPHVPHVAPQKYFDLYPPAKMPLPIEPAAHAKDIPAIAAGQKNYPDLTDGQKRQIIAHYYACVSFMDAQVGVILEALDRLGLRENTIIIFVGDHGWHLGEHGSFWAKVSLLEESVRVPLIVAAPGKMAKTSSPRIVELIDLYPTLTDLCRLKTPAGLQGKSFVPLLARPDQPWEKAAYTVVTRKGGLGKSLRTEQFTFIEWPDGSQQLYNVSNDPREYRNLAKDAAHSATVAEMKQRLKTLP